MAPALRVRPPGINFPLEGRHVPCLASFSGQNRDSGAEMRRTREVSRPTTGFWPLRGSHARRTGFPSLIAPSTNSRQHQPLPHPVARSDPCGSGGGNHNTTQQEPVAAIRTPKGKSRTEQQLTAAHTTCHEPLTNPRPATGTPVGTHRRLSARWRKPPPVLARSCSSRTRKAAGSRVCTSTRWWRTAVATLRRIRCRPPPGTAEGPVTDSVGCGWDGRRGA